MEKAHESASAGNYPAAIGEMNKLIGVKKPDQLPDEFDSDETLGVLERATLKQANDEFDSSTRDFEAADKELEVLDLTGDAVGTLGKYMYSDSSGKYHSSPVEKLALNSFNMMNYLALGDLRGARVEARRFTVMRNFLRDQDPEKAHGAAGSYLAGFTMEKLGEATPAMRYYDEALQERPLSSLAAPAHRLARRSNYRGKKLSAFLAETGEPEQPDDDEGEVLVVVNIGRVPYKVPERMPVGAAVGVAGALISGNPDVLGYSVFKVVVYPELQDVPSITQMPELAIDGESAPLELVSDFGSEIRAEYEALKPQIIAAALSRMIVRAAAAEAARAGGNSQSSGLGWLLALLVEGTMVAMDKPDTRSWNFLPARVLVHRGIVDAGKHEIMVRVAPGPGGATTHEIEVAPGGYATVVVTSPR
jgi:hypothetical protein